MSNVLTGRSKHATASEFNIPHLDVSHLTGHTICLFSEQFPGKPINCRVSKARRREIELDHALSEGAIENLVNNQTIVVLIPFEGQDIAIRARLRKTDGGQCVLRLDKQAVPLSQRRFERFEFHWKIKLATYPLVGSRPRNLTDLRWFETESINLSGGGALIVLPGFLNQGVTVLVNLEAPQISFPSILLGQIRHCFRLTESRFLAGIEFITEEIGKRIVPADRRSIIPASVFEYTCLERERIDRELRREATISPEEK